MHSQQPPGVVQNWSTLQCSKHDNEQCGYDHAPLTRGRMRTQFPLPHGPSFEQAPPCAVTTTPGETVHFGASGGVCPRGGCPMTFGESIIA